MSDQLPTVEGDMGRLQEALPVVVVDKDGVFGNRVSVATAEEDAAIEGRGFIASTSLQLIPRTKKLVICLKNPVGSDVNVHLMRRLLGTTQKMNEVPTYYQAFGLPTFELPDALPALSTHIVGAQAGAMVSMGVLDDDVDLGGFAGSSEPLPVGGFVRERTLETVTSPGNSSAFVIYGTGNTNAMVQGTITLEWYEVQL
jgi:hypothetical protein